MTRQTLISAIATLAALAGWAMYGVENNRRGDVAAGVETLERQLADTRDSLAAAEQARDAATESIADLEFRAAELAEREAALDAESSELSSRLEAADAERNRLAGELGAAQSTLDAAAAERDRLSASLAESVAARGQARARVAALERELVAAVSAEQNVRNEYASLAEREAHVRAGLESRIEELGQEVAALSWERDILDIRLNEESSALAAAREQLLERGAELAEAREEAVGLAAALDETRRDLESARSELAAVRAERERTGESLAALTSEYQRLEGELAAEQERRRDLGESLSSQREGLEEATEALAEARETREAVRSELEAVRSRAGETAELEARLAAADAEIERRADTLQAVRQRVLDLENELDSLNRRSEELAAELELKEAEVNRLNAERDAAREQVASLQQEIEKVVEIKDAEVRQIRESVTMIRMDSDIVFATGSTRLRDEGRAVLDSVADYARQTPERVISLEGHTDSVPIALDNRDRFPSNWELSAARAASAARYLAGRGIDSARIRIVGYGEYQPVGDNDSEEGRRANRRLEIVLAPPGALEEAVAVP